MVTKQYGWLSQRWERKNLEMSAQWLCMQVFKITYCDFYDPSKASGWKGICEAFVNAVSQHKPSMLKKQKVHLILHLVECMELFGPNSSFNSERS